MSKDLQSQQLDRMSKFIEHDAKEMEQNIDNITENNYQMEKEKLIDRGKMEINQLYNNKIKLINRKTATMISTLMTSAKLEILLSRDKHIKSVLAEVNKELIKLRKNKKHHEQILKKLILQAMYQILEEEVNLILISNDVENVKSMIEELKRIYRNDTGMNVTINIESNFMLSIQEIGGVMITAKNRTLIVENTLMIRLLYVAQQAIPLILCGLFGPNPTRTHSSITL